MGKIGLIAVNVKGGIITVVGEDGNIINYAQRGISKLSQADACYCIAKGILYPKAFELKELPSKYSIRFECPEVQGRAVATFNINRYRRQNR